MPMTTGLIAMTMVTTEMTKMDWVPYMDMEMGITKMMNDEDQRHVARQLKLS